MDNTALDHLAEAHEGCSIAAFADLEVGIPLRMAASTKVGQEQVNTLCARAGAVFAALATPQSVAIEATPTAVHVYARVPDDEASVLIAVLDRTVPLATFIAEAKACIGVAP